MIEVVGWFGSVLFAFCALPQALLSIRQKHSNGVSSLLLIMWGTGEILSVTYVLMKHGIDMPLLFNYLMNIVFVSIVTYYKFLPRK